MPCYYPMKGYLNADGMFSLKASPKDRSEVTLPCGGCFGCRLAHASSWVARLYGESLSHEASSFVTLTYSDDSLPPFGGLQYPDVQKMFRAMRKTGLEFRYFVVGEYGDQTHRPHYHALLFGQNFYRDRKMYRTNKQGDRFYTSETLEKYWPHGRSDISDFTPGNAAYCAKYSMKKITGDKAREHYQRVDPRTGELGDVAPEFARMSLKPGIGREYIEKYHRDVATHDGVHIANRKMKTPRYFDQWMKDNDPESYEKLQLQRFEKSLSHLDDQTPERLAVRETVAKAKANLNKREGI